MQQNIHYGFCETDYEALRCFYNMTFEIYKFFTMVKFIVNTHMILFDLQ